MKKNLGPRSFKISGHYREFRRDIIQFFLRLWHNYGDVSQFRIGPIKAYLITHPDDVKHVLQTNNKNYGREVYRNLRLILGNGLLTSEGDFWLRQRRLAQPAFKRKRIISFADTIVDITLETLKSWEKYQPGETINVASEMMHTTLRVVSRALFHTEPYGSFPDIEKAIAVINKFLNIRNNSLIPTPIFIPTKNNRSYRKTIKYFDGLLYQLIEDLRNSKPRDDNLLSMLMAAKDEETGESMSDRQLRDELITLFGAGHETTANTLIWTFFLLSKHPYVEKKLYLEINEMLQGKRPTVESLKNLPYSEMVIREAMRLYPPAFTMARNVINNDEIGGHKIKGKSLVFLSPYVTHRHGDFWENPEGFYPERFTCDNMKAKPRFAYFPFGGGPRLCIGSDFAMMEAQLILVTVLQKYRLDLYPGHQIVFDQFITLQSRYGMKMKLYPRSQKD